MFCHQAEISEALKIQQVVKKKALPAKQALPTTIMVQTKKQQDDTFKQQPQHVLPPMPPTSAQVGYKPITHSVLRLLTGRALSLTPSFTLNYLYKNTSVCAHFIC